MGKRSYSKQKRKNVQPAFFSDLQNPTIHRDLSWLEFNAKVLHEAIDERTPLLERVRFLGIYTSNLDEFFMKRVGVLKKPRISEDGRRIIDAIRAAVSSKLLDQAVCFAKQIKPALKKNKIHLLKWKELSRKERDFANHFFLTNIFPVLTPLAVDPGHPFPFISNLSLSLGVLLNHPEREEEELFARVKVPSVLPQWVRVDSAQDDSESRWISAQDLVAQNLEMLFPGMQILDIMPFRITRNAEIERDEEDSEDLLEMVTEELRERRFADVVRLEHGPNPNTKLLRFLMDELELTEKDVYELQAELDYTSLRPITDLKLPHLKYETWTSFTLPALADEEKNLFQIIRKNDILVHHPYESFHTSVERFVRTAVDDPRVLAIKMTLYRTGVDSPFIPLLIRAAEAGKQVVFLVELKARFDEERNIRVARQLEKAGVHVVYGMVGLKTHCKIALVVRQETRGVRCYAHLGTGNYHAQTARLYTDLGLFTAKASFTQDVVNLFHTLTGRSLNREYHRLLVAPHLLKKAILDRIEREIQNAQAGKPAQIIAKMNALDEKEVIQALYRASQAGVQIDLIVRGICCLRPQVPGLSENIRVLSVIGRFLEHSRIFYFRNGADEEINGEFFIGSSDWMHRNLLFRVETVIPIEDRPLREKCWEILDLIRKDQRQTWEMLANGSYHQRKPQTEQQQPGVQELLMVLTQRRANP